MMKWVLLGILIGFALSVRVTHAGVDGIFAEQSTQFDWVTVRRVHGFHPDRRIRLRQLSAACS